MPAKFTSDTKGRIINGIETSIEEAARLMDDESKTFYMCPGIAPAGFMDLCAGVTVFPTIGSDGKATGTVYVCEVLGEDDPRAVSFRAGNAEQEHDVDGCDDPACLACDGLATMAD